MKTTQLFKDSGFINGRAITHSKSQYREDNPNSVVHYNANIVTINDGKIWYGDLDLTMDGPILKAIARELGQTLFILKESDCFITGEGSTSIELIKKAVWDTTQAVPFK